VKILIDKFHFKVLIPNIPIASILISTIQLQYFNIEFIEPNLIFIPILIEPMIVIIKFNLSIKLIIMFIIKSNVASEIIEPILFYETVPITLIKFIVYLM